MADNVELNAGTGGVTCATDDVAGVHYQVVKLAIGAADSATLIGNAAPVPVSDAGGSLTVDNAALSVVGGGVEATAVRVTLASDSTGLVSVDDNGATLSIDDGGGSITVDGTVAVSGTVTVGSHAVTNAGTFATQVDGAALTALQLIDDAIYADDAAWTGDTSKHTLVGGIYQSTPQTVTDGRTAPIQVDSSGNVKVTVASGGVAGKAEDAAHVSGDEGIVMLAVRRDTAAVGSGTDGDYSTINVNASGRVYTSATIDAALPAGTNNIGEVVGDAAHDAAIAGNPLRIAGRALTADYTAVAAGDTADLITTLLGKLVTIPYANPNQSWSYAAPAGGLTSTTAVTIKSAAGAGVRNYITHIDCVNSHQTTSTELVINDGAAGTVLWRGWLQAAGGGYSINFDPPLRGTANTLLEIDEITATGTAGVVFNATGFTAAE